MDGVFEEGGLPESEVFEGTALDDLEMDRREEVESVTLIKPSESMMDIKLSDSDRVVAVDVRKPLSHGLAWTIDVMVSDSKTGKPTEIAEGLSIGWAPTMPDGRVIDTAIDMVEAYYRGQNAVFRLLNWIAPDGVSEEFQRLVEEHAVSVSCTLNDDWQDGPDVIYTLKIWAGDNPELGPSELFA